ncbi:hypothetical protein SAMN05444359_1427 [Neolewinella agarilytica]|uniref:Uncharacterized protein n=1 Tax=Neolewinella agarilytica TaxID=478744 RepID=A0A1H9P306_9BACT|nr:hypothetical protein SAMN05444359_1427 [Neolewinella agarilytica]
MTPTSYTYDTTIITTIFCFDSSSSSFLGTYHSRRE